MRREEHVVEAMSAKNDLIATGELIDTLEDLIPGVLGHKTDERVQTDNRLLIEMVENIRSEDIDMVTPTPYWMNVRS
jgi:energy-converting hydrogenase A subunit M